MHARRIVGSTGIAILVASGSIAAAAAAPQAVPGGGYLPALQRLGETAVTFAVPKMPCGKNSSGRVLRVGMFGSYQTKSGTHPWALTVRDACVGGQLRAAGRASVGDKVLAGMSVKPGDVITLTADSSDSFSISDETAQRGTGVGLGTTGKWQADPGVLFGGRLVGHLPKPLIVRVRKAQVHRKALGAFAPSRQSQRSGNTVLVRPGALRSGGTVFRLRVN